MRNRLDFILSHTSPTDRVLHIGCCGDEWQFDRAWRKGSALHQALERHVGSKRLVGVDINRKRLGQMKRMGYAVVYANAENLDGVQELRRYRADVIVAGELIEHLTLPGRFLDTVGQCLALNGKLILTTPNAFGFWFWLLHGMMGKREVWPEHTCYLTHSTLTNLLARHRWEVAPICHLGPDPGPRRFRWLKDIPERVDRLCPTLGVVAQKPANNREMSRHLDRYRLLL